LRSDRQPPQPAVRHGRRPRRPRHQRVRQHDQSHAGDRPHRARGDALRRACFCTNSLCSPSRASILTGTYNHVNGVTSNSAQFDARQPTFVSLLQAGGYQTFLSGKWHLGHGGTHDPVGFDRWSVLPGQGRYWNPEFLDPQGRTVVRPGYVTDVITDLALEWLAGRDRSRPFCALVQHKAPHEAWEPSERHARLYAGTDIDEPPTLRDDYQGRATPAREATMRIGRDLPAEDFKASVPVGLTADQQLRWKYQRYIKDTYAASPPSTRTSHAFWTSSTRRTSPRRPWWCTPPIRGSSSATMAGMTSASCTRNRCGCCCWCATRAKWRQGRSARRWR